MPDTTLQGKPTDEIQVTHLRLILMLPLRLTVSAEAFVGQLAAPGSHWQEVPDLLRALDKPNAAQPLGDAGVPDSRRAQDNPKAAQPLSDENYAEYLYFHPFVRRFLYRPADSKSPPMRMWAHRRYRALDVTLPQAQDDNKTTCLRFALERCHLKLFSVGVVMLVVELNAETDDGKRPINLAQTLDTVDFLRRAYPGFFHGSYKPNLQLAGGRYPLAASWVALADKTALSAPGRDAMRPQWEQRKADFLAQVEKGAWPLDPLWKDLLGPVASQVEQIEDDRMPHMAYIATPEPRDISRADWVRLAFADYQDSADKYPYAPEFLESFEKKYCYDRWYSPSSAHDHQYLKFNTRYLNSGYGFGMVGASGNTVFTSDLQQHFRRHYAQMGLMAHFNKAALLVFSNRLSEAVDHQEDAELHRKETGKILDDLLEFTHRYWFAGVSNQMQANELYAYWQEHLGLRELYADVMAEAQATHERLNTIAEQRQSDEIRLNTLAEQHQSAAIERLTHWGLRAAVLGVVLAIFGAGFPFDKPLSWFIEKNDLICYWPPAECTILWHRFLPLPLLFLLTWLGWKVVDKILKPRRTP